MKRNKNIQGYVRVDSNQRPVGASMIMRRKKPYGKFKEMLNPSADVCCPPVSACAANHLFASVVISPSNEYSAGVWNEIDADNNTYLLYEYTDAPQGPNEMNIYSILKRDYKGEILWDKRLDITSFADSPIEPFCLKIDKIGKKLFVWCDEGGLICLDLDGNVLWAKQFDRTLVSTGSVINNLDGWQIDISPDGAYLYFNGRFDYIASPTAPESSYVAKVDAATGTIVKDVFHCWDVINGVKYRTLPWGMKVGPDGSVFIGEYTYPLSGPQNTPDDPGNHYIKMDADLNVLWTTQMGPYASRGTSYGDDFILDYEGNLIQKNAVIFDGVDSNRYVQKYDGATGDILWQSKVTNSQFAYSYDVQGANWYEGRVDEQGNIYLGCDIAYLIGGDTISHYTIAKLTPDGTAIDFMYSIQYDTVGVTPTNIGYIGSYWYNNGTEGPNLSKCTPFLWNGYGFTANRGGVYYSTGFEFRLPPTLVAGTYGDYVFTDQTSSGTISTTYPTYVRDSYNFLTFNILNNYWADIPTANLVDVSRTFITQPL